ncbi:hypothetical protein BXZ70DRAFT_189985 [Cristinia sonorae]|uniref:Uncharacterized protein n=1 Tax=Cristinia sonorae TaxID=1940300 RepID=A0A8K0UQD2_9AGAR|nr:hypothetical protein BXZ70DRAFT_189985 [Cristinia sonorae]
MRRNRRQAEESSTVSVIRCLIHPIPRIATIVLYMATAGYDCAKDAGFGICSVPTCGVFRRAQQPTMGIVGREPWGITSKSNPPTLHMCFVGWTRRPLHHHQQRQDELGAMIPGRTFVTAKHIKSATSFAKATCRSLQLRLLTDSNWSSSCLQKDHDHSRVKVEEPVTQRYEILSQYWDGRVEIGVLWNIFQLLSRNASHGSGFRRLKQLVGKSTERKLTLYHHHHLSAKMLSSSCGISSVERALLRVCSSRLTLKPEA